MTRIGNWWKTLDGFSRTLFVALCAMAVLNIAVVTSSLAPTDTRDALTGYSEQVAIGTIGDPKDAVIAVGDPVEVTGERCNSSGQVLEVSFSYSWRLEGTHDDVRYPSLSGSLDRPAGCSKRVLQFPMPVGVVEYAEKVGKDTVWHIEGLETPIDDEGNLGTIKYWESTPFTVQAPTESE